MLTISENEFVTGLADIIALSRENELTPIQIGSRFGITVDGPRPTYKLCLCRLGLSEVPVLCVRRAGEDGFCNDHRSRRLDIHKVKCGPRLGYCVYPKVWIGDEYVLSVRRSVSVQKQLCNEPIENGKLFCEKCEQKPRFEQRSARFIADKSL